MKIKRLLILILILISKKTFCQVFIENTKINGYILCYSTKKEDKNKKNRYVFIPNERFDKGKYNKKNNYNINYDIDSIIWFSNEPEFYDMNIMYFNDSLKYNSFDSVINKLQYKKIHKGKYLYYYTKVSAQCFVYELTRDQLAHFILYSNYKLIGKKTKVLIIQNISPN